MIVSGSVSTFCSKITLPASSTMHTDVSFTDTSRPTKCAISSLLPRCSRSNQTSIHSSSQKGLLTQHPRLNRSRRDTPSVGMGNYLLYLTQVKACRPTFVGETRHASSDLPSHRTYGC